MLIYYLIETNGVSVLAVNDTLLFD